MQGLPYSYRFYDSIFSMVNVRYTAQKKHGFYDFKEKVSGKEHDGHGHDHGKEGKSIRKSAS